MFLVGLSGLKFDFGMTKTFSINAPCRIVGRPCLPINHLKINDNAVNEDTHFIS